MTENESKDKSKFQECNDFPVVWSSGELTKQRKYSLVRVEDDQKFVIRYARPPMHTGLSIKPAKDKLLWEVEGRLNANLAESFGLRVVNEPRDRKVQASLSDDEIEAILDFGLIEATSDSKKSFNVALYLPTGMVLKFLRKTWRPNPEVKKTKHNSI